MYLLLISLLLHFSPHLISAFCPIGCICTDGPSFPSVECDNVGLTNIPILFNPRIRSLVLSNNRIASVSADDLGFYSELEQLDISNNKILNIERGAFYRLSKLKTLRLNGNLLVSLSMETFTGLSDLRHLDLSENGIRRLGASVFSDLRRLEILNISRNSINHISPGSMAGLTGLKELYFQYNELSGIPTVALRPLHSLQQLDLSHNRITRMEENALAGLKHLESLNLAWNILESMDERAFYGLRALRQLILDSNRLRRIPTISFRPLTDLRQLSLNENQLFTEISTSAFEGLPFLRQLSISKCPQLRRVELNAFSGLSNLEILILSENRQLSYIHQMAFEYGADPDDDQAYSPVRKLYIFANNFTSLPRSLLPWTRLEQLDSRWNPWRCDCQFGSWIGRVLRRIYDQSESGEYPEGAVCVEPDLLRGKPLHKLGGSTMDDLEDCQSSVTSNSIRLILTMATVITALTLATIVLIFSLRYRRKLPCYECCSFSSYSGVSPIQYRYSPPPGLPELCRYAKAAPTVADERRQEDGEQYGVRKLLADRRVGYQEEDGWKYGEKNENGQIYEDPDGQYASCGTSGYYSCVVSENGSSRLLEAPDNLASRGSFRVLQKYPVPVTEL